MLESKRIVIWGIGREGTAAAAYLAERGLSFTLVDDQAQAPVSIMGGAYPVISDPTALAAALATADTVIKSPGISLYHPLLEKEKARGLRVTSLLNLWRADNPTACCIGVTGTKGKSTTATLLAHVLNQVGQRAVVLGNIGIPVSQSQNETVVYHIVEMSSFQAAVFSERFPLSILTSLFPEHLDWHRSLAQYYRDKANLLAHSDTRIVSQQAMDILETNALAVGACRLFGAGESWHFEADRLYKGNESLGVLPNPYLLRVHNKNNVCAVMTALDALGLDPRLAVAAMATYQGLPHRQQELGEKEGILYVDDSISTTPQSALAALKAYAGRPITLIAGGFDRGINYNVLVDDLDQNAIQSVICMGASGQRLYAALTARQVKGVFMATSMREAVKRAQEQTPRGGVILLSPAAPSFGLFRDYVDRAACFAKESQF